MTYKGPNFSLPGLDSSTSPMQIITSVELYIEHYVTSDYR